MDTTTRTQNPVKAKHRATWELGDYPKLADDVIPDLGADLVAACGITRGHTVLDVACGSGNATIPAARNGARVTGCDLSQKMLEAAKARANRAGLEIDWREGDAEALPFTGSSFDVVLSCVGTMFAPDHERVADELVRVCRPGGTIGLANWTPDGFVASMLTTMRPYAPVPAPGAKPPVLWGDPSHVRELFGDRVTDLHFERPTFRVSGFADPAAFRDEFKFFYGPAVAVYGGLAGDPERVAALDHDLDDLIARADIGGGDGLVMEWDYLRITARRPA